MDSIIDEIREKMGKFPEARVEYDASSITYYPDSTDGFVVRLTVLKNAPDKESYSVFYNGLHEEFDRRSSAILAFGFGLSTGCRLREFVRAGEPYRWIVDLKDDQRLRWKPDWEILRFSTAFWQFWHSPTIRCLQNTLIDISSEDGPNGKAGVLAPAPPRGGLPSLSAAKELATENKHPDEPIEGFGLPTAHC